MNNLWLVINRKNGKTYGIANTRQEARDLKSSKGGAAKGVTIIKYIPVEEIR